MSYTPFSNGQYNSSAPTLSSGQIAPLQLDVNGNLKITNSGGGSGTVNVTQWDSTNVGAPTAYGTAPGTGVNPAFVQVGTVSSQSGTNYPVSLPGSSSVGNLVLAIAMFDGNDGTSPVPTISTDNHGNTYSLLGSFVNSIPPGPSLTSIVVYGTIVTTAGTISTNMTSSIAQRGGAVMIEYSNVQAVVDQSANAQTATSATLSAGPVTTTQASELLLCVGGSISGNPTFTASSGFTIRVQGNTNSSITGILGIEDQVVSSTGSYSAGFSTMGATNDNSVLFLTLKGVVVNTNSISVNAFITNTPTVTVGSALPVGSNIIGHVEVDDGSGHIQPAGDAVARSINVQVNDGTNVLGTSAHPVKVDPTGTTTQPVSGTVTANQGTANTSANAWPVEITDGTNVNSVKAASTAAASTDKSIVVQLNPIQPNLTTAMNVQDVADGPVSAGTAATKSNLVGGVANTSAPTPTAGQQIAIQLDTQGNQRVNPSGGAGSFSSSKTSAAGNGGTVQLTLTVPAATKWEVGGFLLLVQAANASSPRVISANAADASSNFLYSGAAGVNAPINANTLFMFGPSIPLSTSITATNASIPMPILVLGPASTINVFIQNTNASDTLTLTAMIKVYPN